MCVTLSVHYYSSSSFDILAVSHEQSSCSFALLRSPSRSRFSKRCKRSSHLSFLRISSARVSAFSKRRVSIAACRHWLVSRVVSHLHRSHTISCALGQPQKPPCLNPRSSLDPQTGSVRPIPCLGLSRFLPLSAMALISTPCGMDLSKLRPSKWKQVLHGRESQHNEEQETYCKG